MTDLQTYLDESTLKDLYDQVMRLDPKGVNMCDVVALAHIDSAEVTGS